MDLFNKKKVATLSKEIERLNQELNTLKIIKDQELYKLNQELEHLKLTKDELSYVNLKQDLIKLNDDINSKQNNINNLNNQEKLLLEECARITDKIEKDSKKLSKIKPLYSAIQNIINKYSELDIFNNNIDKIRLTYQEELIDELAPTVTLHLHSMDVKSLRQAFNINKKAIDAVLAKYENRYTTKANLAIYRLMVIALRAELQNVLFNLKYSQIDKTIQDIKSITTKYLAIADDGNKQILGTLTKFISEIEYLFIEAAQIEYEYYIKKQREKEEQAALKEQMKQEAEERKLLAQQQKQVEKEEEKYKNEISKIQELINNSDDDIKLKELQDKILELQNLLEKVEDKKDEIISRQNGKAGYVYVISNLGSFGDNIFKIGMTRRINPMDRISELSSASVPFSFDVHSFIFSHDAVSLEQELHRILNNQRVNKINLRKEFFKVNIDELRKIVDNIDPSAEFNTTMLAEQYRETLALEE